MTDQEIIIALGIEQADETLQQACINNFRVTIHARLMNTLGELLTDEDMTRLERMEADGSTTEEMLGWLSQSVANAKEMRQALEEDYVADLRQRL